jgi:hypothetical protein
MLDKIERNEACDAVCILCHHGSLNQSRAFLIAKLVSLMNSDLISVRNKALKVISAAIAENINILNNVILSNY